MKAKSSYSHLEKTYARGVMVVFGGITLFVGGFVAWSFSCAGGACIDFVRNLV